MGDPDLELSRGGRPLNRNTTEIEAAWAVEVERRAAEIDRGAVQLIPMDVALAQVRAKIK